MRRRAHWALAFLGLVLIAACTTAPEAADQAEIMRRWNLSAAGVTAPFFDGRTVDFNWDDAEQFPHPTYKGDSEAAYQAFAQVFLDFFSRADNFEFLKQRGLLNIRLYYKFPGGELGLDTSFDKLSGELADPNYLPGFLSSDTRNKLMMVHQMIHDAL